MAAISVGSDELLAPLLSRFTEVRIIDSTVIALPASLADEFPGCGGTGGGNTAAMKLQTEMELRSGTLQCIQLEEGKSPDQATTLLQIRPQEGSLQIADLGNFSRERLSLIQQSKAFYISRLLNSMNICVEGKTFKVVEYLKVQGMALVDINVKLGSQPDLECRLFAWRVPTEMAASVAKSSVRTRRRKDERQPKRHWMHVTGICLSPTSIAICSA